MKKQFIICPTCEKDRKTKIVLAQILPSGGIAVKRIGSAKEPFYTIIFGKNIKLLCGNCGTLVYSKNQI